MLQTVEYLRVLEYKSTNMTFPTAWIPLGQVCSCQDGLRDTCQHI